MIDWKFNIGDEVYDKARKQNGVVTMRKYQESSNEKCLYYNVCFAGPERIEYEWGDDFWLEFGHRGDAY